MSVACTGGCPAPVRPGTPSCLCVLFCKCLPRPSLGVQGALIAMLFDPLPLGRPGFVAHSSRYPDARSCSLRPKGKGYRPCTPTNLGRTFRLPCITIQIGSSSLRRASWPPPRCVLCVFATIQSECDFARRSTRTTNRRNAPFRLNAEKLRFEGDRPLPASDRYRTNAPAAQVSNTTGPRADWSRLRSCAPTANEECPVLTATTGQRRRLFNGLTGESIETQRRFDPSVRQCETSRIRANPADAAKFAFSSHSPLSHDRTEIHGSADSKHPSRNWPETGSPNQARLATGLSKTAPCFEDKAVGLQPELLVRRDSLPVTRQLGRRALVAMMPVIRV